MAEFKFSSEQISDIVRSIYNALTASEIYQSYINTSERELKSEKEILTYIFTDLMLPDENFVAHIEEYFTNWDDDADMLNLLMASLLQKPAGLNLQQMPDKEKTEFAENLLQAVTDKKDYVSELIKARLKNWDPERIAVVDIILMQM